MNLVAYLRISKTEVGSQSLDTQRRIIIQWSEIHGHRILAWFADDGVSGGIPMEERPEGENALLRARNRDCGGIVVAKLDRLGRELKAILELADTLNIVSATEPFDTTTAMGKAFLSMLGTFAEFERNKIRERTREALHTKRLRGERLGGNLPYGLRATPSGKLAVHKGETEMMQQADSLCSQHGYAEAAKLLNARGLFPRDGKDGSGRVWDRRILRKAITAWRQRNAVKAGV
jgi:site-specific DNA recombinase